MNHNHPSKTHFQSRIGFSGNTECFYFKLPFEPALNRCLSWRDKPVFICMLVMESFRNANRFYPGKCLNYCNSILSLSFNKHLSQQLCFLRIKFLTHTPAAVSSLSLSSATLNVISPFLCRCDPWELPERSWPAGSRDLVGHRCHPSICHGRHLLRHHCLLCLRPQAARRGPNGPQRKGQPPPPLPPGVNEQRD